MNGLAWVRSPIDRFILAELEAKLPTGGLVVLQFDSASWTDIGPEEARLARFVTPRMLMR